MSVAFLGCGPAFKLLLGGGTEKLTAEVPQAGHGPYVLIFALDGVGHDQFEEAAASGLAPHLDELVGKGDKNGIHKHCYTISNALSVLPSTTYNAWASVFTGRPPAYTAIPGNEWYVRETMTFWAPAPVSLPKPGQSTEVYTDDLVGKQLMVPSLYEMVNGPTFVSLNMIYRGANIFTSLPPISFAAFGADFEEGNLKIGDPLDGQRNAYARLDLDSVPLVVDAIEKHGVPSIQTVYFPGIDLYTHIAQNPLPDQVKYLERITDPCVGKIIDEYRKKGALDETFILFISDHGHTPVLHDQQHALGAHHNERARAVLEKDGFRVRENQIKATTDDFQAVLAYQGAMAYVYLADRSTCRNKGSKCDWNQPPRFDQDVIEVANAFEQANQGDMQLGLNNTLDLIFARRPVAAGQMARPYEILDRGQLVPIADYLKRYPRPDLIGLDERMRWLSEGPYGNRAGDVLLLSKSGLNRPIEDRYYFSAPYNSWHGSPTLQDSNITFAIGCPKRSGAELRRIVERIQPKEITQLSVVPLVRELLKEPISAGQNRPDISDVARSKGNVTSDAARPETPTGLKP